MKYLIIITIFVLGICPWLKAPEAVQIVEREVLKLQEQEPDLCAVTIHPETIQRVPFGFTEQVSFDCTANDPIYGVVKSTNIVFITFYKGLWGLNPKILKKNL